MGVSSWCWEKLEAFEQGRLMQSAQLNISDTRSWFQNFLNETFILLV
jgi:hypothetical protein